MPIFPAVLPRRPVLVSALLAFLAACGKGPAPTAPPPEVSVIAVEPKTIDAHYEWVGQAEASKKVEVRSHVQGIIVDRPYVEGTDIPQGTVLFRIDPTTYEATYRAAQARLVAAAARLDNANRNLARLEPLLPERAVAQKDVDDARTEAEQALADRDRAQADLDRAKKDYDDTWVRAEIPGRVGRALLVLGARVTGPTDLLTTVEQLDPIYVNFSPSDQDVLRWRRDIETKRITVPTGFQTVEVTLSDGSPFPQKGKLNFADLALQPQTGTLQLRAEFRNPQRILLPGQFVRVHILGVKRNGAILVPQRAVLQGQGGAYVYVVDTASKATARDVVLAGAVGDQWVVDTGLKAGEQVVVEGIQKVVAGQLVKVAATTQPPTASPVETPGAN
jgi:membrane fusion protein (multidrug efflux system)